MGLVKAVAAAMTLLVVSAPAQATVSRVALPPGHGAVFDYQIGGAYRPSRAVQIVDRDRTDSPSPGHYNICYINAFQTQPAATAWWRAHHRTLLLRDRSGREVVDPDWGETLLDVSTPSKRAALLGIVGSWIDGCARRGFQAVELDNLDSYTRSHGLLTSAEAVAFAGLLVRRAHAEHLAAAQKNAAELSSLRRRTGFDFAIAEECQVYAECAAYTRVYGWAVIEIEYTDNPLRYFTAACQDRGRTISIELSDRDVLPAAQRGHVRRWC